jgi:3-hydroxyisobutyrate dehydrogenase-like beta-hydroxyacid dehydrogenase
MSAGSQRVSVLGTGTMGSALARALLRAGHSVTVWNRTAERAAPLGAEGAAVALGSAAAIAASETAIVCVASPDVVDEVLAPDDVREALKGRTLVQLTTGRPDAIRRGASPLADLTTFLGGAILAFPRMIGTPDAVILIGGDGAAAARVTPLLEALGTVRVLGSDPGDPSAMDAALIAFFYGSISGFLSGARIARAAGLDPEAYVALAGPFLRDFIADAVTDTGGRALSGDLSDPQSSLDTHFGGIDDLVLGTAGDVGVESPALSAVRDELAVAIAAGQGDLDIAALLDPAGDT